MTGCPAAQALPGRPSSKANSAFSLTALNSEYSSLQRQPPNSRRVRVRSGTHNSTTRINVFIGTHLSLRRYQHRRFSEEMCDQITGRLRPKIVRGRTRLTKRTSVPIGRIGAIELAQQRRPGEVAVASTSAGLRLHPLIGVFEDVLRRVDQLGVAGQRHDLHLAGALEAEQNIECGGNGTAYHEQSMIAQDHGFVVSEIPDQSLALVDVIGDAFEIVISNVEKPHRSLRQRQQSAF